MRYRIYDNDLNEYVADGEIFECENQCIDYLQGFFSREHKNDELKQIDLEYCKQFANFEFVEVV